MKKILLVFVTIATLFTLTGCGVKEDLLGISYDVDGNETTLDQYDTKIQ